MKKIMLLGLGKREKFKRDKMNLCGQGNTEGSGVRNKGIFNATILKP